MKFESKDYVKETGLSEKDVQELKETFKVNYAVQKGWEVEKLTTEQLLEIQNQEGYKKAGQLFS